MKGRSYPIPNKDAGTMPANAPERDLTSQSADVNVQSGRSATVRLLQVLMIAALVLPLLLFTFASWVSYRDIHALADERIERSLDVVQEQALRVLQSINLAFFAVEKVLGDRSDNEIDRDEAQLHDQLRLIASELPEVQSIWVFNRSGHAQVTGTIYPAPATRDYAEEDFFRRHQNGYGGTYVGAARTRNLADSSSSP